MLRKEMALTLGLNRKPFMKLGIFTKETHNRENR